MILGSDYPYPLGELDPPGKTIDSSNIPDAIKVLSFLWSKMIFMDLCGVFRKNFAGPTHLSFSAWILPTIQTKLEGERKFYLLRINFKVSAGYFRRVLSHPGETILVSVLPTFDSK